MQRGVVNEKPVFVLPVLPQGFSVVAEEEDSGLVEAVQLLQASEDATDLRVVESDLSIVRMARVLAQVRLGGPVGAVRVVEVQPDEKWRAALLVQPVEHTIDRAIAPPLDEEDVGRAAWFETHVVVIDVKASVQSPHGIKSVRTDESRGAVTPAAQHRRERGDASRQSRRSEVSDTVEHGVSPRQDHGVRRQRNGHLRVGIFKAHSHGG